eukprot:tig00001206_g7504.t1
MPGKLKFRVVHATSADEQFPAAELNSHTPQTRGWCSARFCEYPQELVVQLEAPALVQQLQILSHEAKISTRIELFIGEPGASSDFRAAKFKRLGHLSLDSNERSSYQARELKSVHINTRAAFVKLVLHKCYLNKMNLFNQVGIIALSFVGDVGPADSVSDLSAPVSNPSRVNPGQQIASNQPAADLMMDITLDEYVSQRIRELTRSKDAAVAREDYDEAKKIKDSLGTLKDLGIQLAKLELQKKRAVQREDYDTAKNLKVEIDNLRNVVDQISSGLRTESLSAGSRQQPASRQQPSRALQEASVELLTAGSTGVMCDHLLATWLVLLAIQSGVLLLDRQPLEDFLPNHLQHECQSLMVTTALCQLLCAVKSTLTEIQLMMVLCTQMLLMMIQGPKLMMLLTHKRRSPFLLQHERRQELSSMHLEKSSQGWALL